MLSGGWSLCRAQNRLINLQRYLSETNAVIDLPEPMTASQWKARHPEEVIESPVDGRMRGDDRKEALAQLEGSWCLRSVTEINLADGIRVRRIALFYQPLVQYSQPDKLPPLPTEKGAALREQGCRLVRIISEFTGTAHPQRFARLIASQIPAQRSPKPLDYFPQQSYRYWAPFLSFNFPHFWFLYTHHSVANEQAPANGSESSVLLEGETHILRYGPPPAKTIFPSASQPWLALQAAIQAKLPEGPTLRMLGLLVPPVGYPGEQQPLDCNKQLVPLLSDWLALAAQAPANEHAAALILADKIAHQIPDCLEVEAQKDGAYPFPNRDAANKAFDTLKRSLRKLGIQTQASVRGAGPIVYYTGNLLDQIHALAPTGVAEELYQVALLDRDECVTDESVGRNCSQFIRKGEQFLARFHSDAWTPSIHLMLVGAYSAAVLQADYGYSQFPAATITQYRKKALEHYRAWYAVSTIQRDRYLVWQEMWSLQAGLAPKLRMAKAGLP
jgi:hypothetical protein